MMKRKLIIGKVFLIFCLLLLCIQAKATQQCDSVTLALMEDTWREFRKIHPFGFQTVALKHWGDTCVFVMSEPSRWVKSEDLENLFLKYGGHLILGRQPFGYDGALYDAIGCAALDSVNFKRLEKKLFNLLNGTSYKTYYKDYTNLDNPSPHVFFRDLKLEYNMPSLDWEKWKSEIFIDPYENEKELREIIRENLLRDLDFSIPRNFSTNDYRRLLEENRIFFSRKHEYVLWLIKLQEIFRLESAFFHGAQIFTHWTDLIINVGCIGNYIYVLGRRRQIPISVLPPLRSETIQLLFSLDDKDFYACINPNAAMPICDSIDSDTIWATPITLSKKLQNTELGNLIFLSEVMLKSWSENAKVEELFIDYPKPSKYPFPNGVEHELGYTPQCMWSIDSGSSYSLSPIYKTTTDSVLIQLSQDAYAYYAGLNNTDLVRLAQYAFLYRAIHPIREIRKKFPEKTESFLPTSVENDEQWIQTPSTTVSNHPWGSISFQDD